MAIKALTKAEYDEQLQNDSSGFLLDFWRENCGTCKSLSQELGQLSEENPELRIYSVNIDSEPELVRHFRVMMSPTLLLVKNDAVLKKSIGYKSKEHILELVNTYLASDTQ